MGRTGTFMALYFLIELERLHKMQNSLIEEYSIFGTVRSLKEQRMYSVQKSNQFEYIYATFI